MHKRIWSFLAVLAMLAMPLTAMAAPASTPDNPVFFSLLPPLFTIGLALATRSVIPALFLGVVLGSWGLHGLDIAGLWSGTLDSVAVHVTGAVANADHAAVMVFSFMIGGMVGIISRNGGMQGIVAALAKKADNRRHGQLATAGLGVAIFIDDYANTLVVGNTMRPVTDKLRISREKLAYIVDSTAAPVSCIALITTWIGYEVGLIGDSLSQLGAVDVSAYEVFLTSILYSFYPFLALLMVFVIAYTGRDYGPMYVAEHRALTTGQLLAPGATVDDSAQKDNSFTPAADCPKRAINAILPISVLVVGVIGSMYMTGAAEVGHDAGLRDILGAADAYLALVWGSLLGVLTATILSLVQKLMTLEQVIEAWYKGARGMFLAMIILILAWSLANVTTLLGTGPYLVGMLGDSLPIGLLPAVTFVVAAFTAFATGSSWGAMGILMPLVIPLAWSMLGNTDPTQSAIFFSTIACVLSGSVWGDHCSPISDTTVLSSLASSCDHVDHVRTQLPYAMTAGTAALLLGTVPAGYGFPWWASLLLGAGAIVAVIRFVGRKPEDQPATPLVENHVR